MADPVKVEWTYDPATGESTFEIVGMKGTGCSDLMSALTKGNEVKEQKETCEYFEEQGRPDYIDQGQGE